MSELSLLLIIAVIGALWLDYRRVQDIAVAHCRQACERAGVQFLDDIAPVWRVRLARDANGVLRLRRVFTFEYSTAAGERRSGSIVMLGRVPLALYLEDAVDVRGGETDRFYP
jgi:Protein of unknown function (DUF3301)